MIPKAIGYGVLYLAINTVATVGVVGMTEHGGDVQMARLTRNVEALTVEVADLKRQIEVIGGGRVENSNRSAQYVLVQSAEVAGEIEHQRLKDIRVREYLSEQSNGMQ